MGKATDGSPDFAPYFVSRECAGPTRTTIMESIYQLRYQVYCVECRFLEADAFPDGRESDQYDAESAHFCAENLNGEIVGYVRLVPSDSSSRRFPWEQYCSRVFAGVELPPPEESGEISRLMVRGDYRRRKGDMLAGVSSRDSDAPLNGERRSDSPQILLSLYRQMYQHSLKAGIRYWYAAMERPLARSLSRMNFAFRQIGEEADYFGPVAPYVADLRELEARVGQSNPALLAWMQKPDVTHS